MGREVRRVPADWQHPKYTEETAPFARAVGRYIPMFDGGYAEAAADWDEESAQWEAGYTRNYGEGGRWVPRGEEQDCSFEEWHGERPRAEEYMPDWPEADRTHFMMYEDTSEGTPISPAFETPEALARWLADTGASAFADQTASYEAWLRIANGGFAPSAVMIGGKLTSGVEGLS